MTDCLNCALYDCWYCAQNLGEYYGGGCCCGRITPEGEDDEWEDDDE